ncbi:uncharacterized protein RCC_04070 [Ramularia collo-cygni]|uniref:Uncharacterized protein n=1 Tax=Ramularia collo-cygni TaxID=112498 RepID=A0A2D3V3V9_9PEZI|nr:uncharacterized protein RCC_04070 [Ramularia collo-cygni]CZT18226.1 uncharacterized protein RCC_04070 [Ramularia collo-cygni]
MNSPTLSCSAGGTPTVNTTAPYCVIPGGAQRMDYCCSDKGSAVGPDNGNVGLVPDCYFWCELVFNGQGDIDDQFSNAKNAFSNCLTTGTNASKSLGGMSCSKGASNGDANGGSGDTPPEDSGVTSSKHKNVKLAGFTGALLIAGMAVGVL